jgi:hypothetical protein
MRPDRQRMLSWLRHEPVRPDGEVLSWVNPSKPGYAYPEAAGLWLSLACEEGPPGELEARVARKLAACTSDSGGVGRGGIDYAFDTAVALRGLLAFEGAGGKLDDRSVLPRMFEFVAESVEARRAVLSGPQGERWSNSYAPHLLKLVFVIDAWREASQDRRCESLRSKLAEELVPKAFEWLAEPIGETPRYVHAVCYAAEALLELSKDGVEGPRRGVESAASWFSSLQTQTGALPAWSGRGPEIRLASDATAQAVRLWLAIDRDHFAPNVARALEHLSSVQHASGGLLYDPTGDDVNTWCTVFAAQALCWADGAVTGGLL